MRTGAGEVALGGDGFVIGAGRVRQVRKFPLRAVLVVVAILALVAGGVAFGLVWLSSRVQFDTLTYMRQGAWTWVAWCMGIAGFAVVALIVQFVAPVETWGLLMDREDWKFFQPARRLTLLYSRHPGTFFDAIRGDDGIWYRPSIDHFIVKDDALIALFVIPRVLRGGDLDAYTARLRALGPEFFGVYSVSTEPIRSAYWGSRLPVTIIPEDHGQVVRHVQGL